MPEKIRIRFSVNGGKREVETYPMARLLDVLREDLHLTGIKEGCGEGECGACSVIIDGELANSCLIPALQAGGTSITTIEGLAPIERLDRVQAAFLEHGAAQGGICTPGMMLAPVHLLERRSSPTAVQSRGGRAGNLCRCTRHAPTVGGHRRAPFWRR